MVPSPTGVGGSAWPHLRIAGGHRGKRPIRVLAQRCRCKAVSFAGRRRLNRGRIGRAPTEWNGAAATPEPFRRGPLSRELSPSQHHRHGAVHGAAQRTRNASHVLGASRRQPASHHGCPYSCREPPRGSPSRFRFVRVSRSQTLQAWDFKQAAFGPASDPGASGAAGLEAGAGCRIHRHERIGRAPDDPPWPPLPSCSCNSR
jgi:hypothetical protein